MESKSLFFLVAHIEDTREPVMFATLEHLVSWITWRFTASTGLSVEMVRVFEALNWIKLSPKELCGKSDKWRFLVTYPP